MVRLVAHGAHALERASARTRPAKRAPVEMAPICWRLGFSRRTGLYYLGPERIAVAGDGFKWMVMAKHAEGGRRRVVGSGKPCGRPGVECAPTLVCGAQGGYRDERCELLERY